MVVKIFVFNWKYLMTKYLGTLFNYDLISNCCQFLMTFIKYHRFFPQVVQVEL